MTESVRRDIYVPYALEAVWRALTEQASLADWLLPNDFEPRVGHRFTFRTDPNPLQGFDGLYHCEVLECTPPTHLEYSWEGGGLFGTRVSYSLERAGKGTRLLFRHSGFDTTTTEGADTYRGAEQGWTGMLSALDQAIGKLEAGS